MYLKALEIQGFKSFPEKTRLTFDHQVTAIVGPNGSGKSNVSDALRWVMGEQSGRALRSNRMEDVIFGGTAKRPQTGFAQVSLILDNSEGDLNVAAGEVMVTRRYYRSGESEYYINKEAARLRDINELFMDTGLGRDGYSVIGQGRIDEILSKKSGDRREIFEEAAGISKFRYRKEEAERRLASAADNLLRINDKIDELEMQIEPLREQAAAAKQYLLYRDELRSLEAAVWLDSLDKIEQAEAKVRTDFEAASRQLDEAREETEKLYTRIEEAGNEMRRCDVAAESLREATGAAEKRIQDIKSGLLIMENMVSANEESMERLRRELSEADARKESVASQRTARLDRVSKIDGEKEEITGQVERLRERINDNQKNSGESTAKREELRAEQERASGDAAAKRAEIAALGERKVELEGHRVGLSERLRDASANLNGAAEGQEETEEELNAASAEAERWAKEKEKLQSELKAAEAKARSVSDAAARLRMDKNNISSRVELLKEMERDFDGYNRAVKSVLQAGKKGFLKNIRGPVSKLIKTGDEYVTAIETALGAAMQNVVVSAQEDGKAAMEYLKSIDGGRATFLPMDAIRPSVFKENLSGERGFLGIASELVRYDGEYENVFSYLLGRTVVAENLSSAVEISRRHSNRLRIVTLDGQMLSPGGSMTGGSVNRRAGILSRVNELERLERELYSVSGRLIAAEESDSKAHNICDEMAEKLYDAELRLRLAQDELLKLKGRLEQHEALAEGLLSVKILAEKELETVRLGLAGLKEREEALVSGLGSAEKRTEELSALITELYAGQKELDDENGGIYEEISALRSAGAALDAEKKACLMAIDELDAAAEEHERGSERRLKEISEYAERGKSLAEQRRDSEKESDKAIDELAALKEKHAAAVKNRLDAEGRQNMLNRTLRDKNSELAGLEREYARLEEKRSGGVNEEKILLDRLWDTYGLTRTTARASAAEIESAAKAKARITRLKNEMRAMGHPNLGAVEEFERVNTRYEYLTGQRADAEKAKTELEGIISRLTENMTDIFAGQFKKINDSFRETFLDIFGGGSAEVCLEDESDILSSGIEIRVQPPGKQVKSISLLSGGERAFVAIALYFSILKIRPTPFCIIDEIDTSLDEVNTVRFAGYLRKIAVKTQFVVVTHRRATMEDADILYGITMQEQGVSKVLCLRLDEIEKELGIE